jgi:hypothetical protein
LESINWTWGLTLIVLTIAFHTTAVVMMAFVEDRIRVGLENRRLEPGRAIPMVIGIVSTVALMLAALHGIESMLWAIGGIPAVRPGRWPFGRRAGPGRRRPCQTEVEFGIFAGRK